MEKEIEVVKQEVVSIEEYAKKLVVASPQDYQQAHLAIAKVKELKSKWTSYWKPLKEKAYATWKDITGREKEVSDRMDSVIREVSQKALSWKQEQDRKAEEERRRLQAEAEEKARREKERLLKEAEKLKTPEKIQERIEQAEAVQVPVISVQREEVKVEGVITKKTWVAELVNMDELIASAKPGSVASSFLQFNQVVANQFAKATKGTVQVSGVKFVEVESFAHKTKKGGE